MSDILLVEDDPTLRTTLTTALTRTGYSVDCEESAESALELLNKRFYGLLICDYKLPGLNGIELLQKVRELAPATKSIVMTAFAAPEAIIYALRGGAVDFICKPFSTEEMLESISRHVEPEKSANERTISANYLLKTGSSKMKQTLELACAVAPFPTPVLLTGESGTGKEVLGRMIHNLSPRIQTSFYGVNCAAIPETLLESELFGHMKGSFTGAHEKRVGLFEAAANGTLFLDEVGDMPHCLQPKLLRALQEKEIRPLGSFRSIKTNARIIAATNKNLKEVIGKGNFRSDLFYRLNVFPIEIPPLRERQEDILPLARLFLSQRFTDIPIPQLSAEAAKALQDYNWPGNIRELENVITRASTLAENVIRPEHLGLGREKSTPDVANGHQPLQQIGANAARSAEALAIKEAMKLHKGNKSQAAKMLAVSYKTLLNKIRDYELD
ncbi:MAG: sigma-54 dependent transcriptional regulator [bacterium]|nr:sigma-54 dependent transcriptional regulator [bacterium]